MRPSHNNSPTANNSGWQISAPAIASLNWDQVWSSQDSANIRVVASIRQSAQGSYRLHRIETGTQIGAGAVVIAWSRRDGIPMFLLAVQDRLGPAVRLWELPRGMADPADVDLVGTGLRELAEETGVQAAAGTLIADIYPDSGLLASKVGVVVCELSDCPQPTSADGEVEEARWFSSAEIDDLIAAGLLRDGISLAALRIFATWSGSSMDKARTE